MKKYISLILTIILLLFSLCSCTTDNNTNVNNAAHSRVKFSMKNGSTFVVELYPEYAPETCENFLKLCSEGFYNGLTFHRVVEGFMAQGGCYDENNEPHVPSNTIKGEFSSNGFSQNTLKHERGVISMGRSNDYDSASSQFFICYEDKTWLDGNYAAFGKVIEGMETIDSFLDVERAYNGIDDTPATPTTPIVIVSAEVLE